MIAKATIGLVLSAMLAASAQAQNFDGTYTGTRTITQAVGRAQCPPPGYAPVNPIEFQVTGSRIIVRYPNTSYTASGVIAADGTFSISGATPDVGPDVTATWSGQIRGARLRGQVIATGSGGECHGTFTTRR